MPCSRRSHDFGMSPYLHAFLGRVRGISNVESFSTYEIPFILKLLVAARSRLFGVTGKGPDEGAEIAQASDLFDAAIEPIGEESAGGMSVEIDDVQQGGEGAAEGDGVAVGGDEVGGAVGECDAFIGAGDAIACL